jgi:hypothetical protein
MHLSLLASDLPGSQARLEYNLANSAEGISGEGGGMVRDFINSSEEYEI